MGPKSFTPQTQYLFGYPLDQHLNLKLLLIQLVSLIDWAEVDKTFSGHFVLYRGRPALPPRLLAGLLYLQHTFDCSKISGQHLSEEPVLAKLHGRDVFTNQLPHMPLEFDALENAHGQHAQSQKSDKIIVDITVMLKTIAHPSDSRLLE